MNLSDLVHLVEVAMCWVFGHDPVEYPNLNYAACTRCTRRWLRPEPLVGEFYD